MANRVEQSRGARPLRLRLCAWGRCSALDGVAGREKLIEKIQKDDRSARAELRAIYLLRRPHIAVEMYPLVSVGTGKREPDFRVRETEGSWTYVEVARPDTADTQRRANALLNRLTQVISSVAKPFTLEVFLLREPNDGEIEELATALPALCVEEGVSRTHIKDLAILILNHTTANKIVPYQHPEDDRRPRLAMAKAIVGGSQPPRQLSVSMPYADGRGEAFLTSEARQLPTDAPGLVMIDMGNAPGGFKEWVPLLERRLQPKIHTRVGGICLFFEAILPTERGIAQLMETRLFRNPHARLPLPAWIVSAVAEAGAEFNVAMGTPTRT